ncbi:diguanylate cyclase [Paraburkholderia bonniea]|uniref:sensor domain-containing diguanylate cyclase n=1 Tax=Paraburkholderia bonniea TaxID=2152891 RepID=UPI0025729582|nr:sensor domain-containing diguanylate cyclase [Paraburkholderia bonniea]WJF89407.1 diguanylate cyclase [Paraburkholderia bonniea]WJF92722.1 diguanylate cyclase [Paraburkholderia bonniea]
MNTSLMRRVSGPASFVLALAACWFAASLIADRMVQQELNTAVQTQSRITAAAVDNMAEVIANDLAMSRAIPATLAELDTIQRVLAQSRNYAVKPSATEPAWRNKTLKTSQLALVGHLLQDAQGFSGLDAIWLIDDNGRGIATSSRHSPTSLNGLSLRQQPCMAQALLGAFNETYGLDDDATASASQRGPDNLASAESGIFIAAPVYDHGVLVGALGAKLGLARLRHWVARPGAFVADANGVVIMAYDRALEGWALPRSPVIQMPAATRISLYHRDAFPTLTLNPALPRMHLQAQWLTGALAAQLHEMPSRPLPALYQNREGLNSALSAHLIDPITIWPNLLRNHQRDRWLLFLALAGAVTLTWVVSWTYLRERRHHQAARQMAQQLQTANSMLSAEARQDALTGALSRRYFLALLRHEVERARVTGTPLCVISADLDHFKQINDDFGHAAGDRALEHFVASCKTSLRSRDAVGRLGGEEFAILLPTTPVLAGIEIAERLRLRLKQQPPAALPTLACVSASFGVAQLAPDEPAEQLLQRADAALYVAKSGGRDRSAAAPPPVSPSSAV